MANNALASCCIAIRIEEPTDGGIIVSALEIVEASFPVVDIPTVAQRVDICQSARCGNDFPVGVIVVACDSVLAAIHNPHHVPLQVGDVIIRRAVVLHGIGQAALIVEKVDDICSPAHAHQLAAGVIIAVSGATHSLAGPQTAGIIGEAQAVGSVGSRRQTSTVDPGKVPASAIEVAGGVANGIIGNAIAVKGSKQILPVGITVGVTVSGSAIGRSQDIARTIVGIGVGRISRRFQQLTLVVVGVGNGALPGSGEGCDITHAVIGITIPLPAAGHGRHPCSSLDGGQVSLVISILYESGICNDYNQKSAPDIAPGHLVQGRDFCSVLPMLVKMGHSMQSLGFQDFSPAPA